MFTMILVFLASPMPAPDMCVLSRPISTPYNLPHNTVIPHDFDVIHYDVSIEVFPQTELLECTTEVIFESDITGLDAVRLDLVQLTVTSVSDNSGPLTFSRVADSLFIDLRSPLNIGEQDTVTVEYSGSPWNEGSGGSGGFYFHSDVYYHMGIGKETDPPSLGRVIFPCWDHLADKASVNFHITVPDTLYAVANGDLVLKQDNPSDATTTYHWEQPQLMSTYLAAFSVSDYTVLQDSTYDWIKYYVYPWEVNDALGSFQNVNLMMDRFESIYAPYPWDTKFSYVETPGSNNMEHATEVYYMDSAIDGTTNYDWLLAHELSHHWWGDCATPADWNDVWLSVGFATYSEALWEETYGQSAYDDYILNNIMIPYLNSGELFQMSNPTTPAEMWSYTTYQKGASVLHMLRHIMGDQDFFDTYEHYYEHHAFNLTSTKDYRDHVWAEYGDIDWFIDEWVHGWGYPVYDIEYSWVQSGPDWDVTVDLEQIQSTPTVFTMPLEFLIIGSTQDSLVVMWNDQAVQSQLFTVPFQPTGVEFDPGNYVLSSHLTGIESPEPPLNGTGTLHMAPNPARESTGIMWTGMEDYPLEVGLFDLSGRMLQAWAMQAGERELDLSEVPSGLYLLQAFGSGGIRQTAKLIVR